MGTTPPLRKTLLAASIAALAALVAAHAVRVAYLALGGTLVPAINVASTTLAAIVPTLLAGVAYFLARRWFARGRAVFIAGALALGVLSAVPQMIAPLQPGMEVLSPLLHVTVAAVAASVIPWWSELGANKRVGTAPLSS